MGTGSWLMLRAAGSFRYQQGGAWSVADFGAGETRSRYFELGALFAFRYHLLQSGPFSLSTFVGAELGDSWLSTRSVGSPGQAKSGTHWMDLLIGPVLEFELHPQLSLRLSGELFRGGFLLTRFDYQGQPVRSNTFSLGLQLAPSLGLAFRF